MDENRNLTTQSHWRSITRRRPQVNTSTVYKGLSGRRGETPASPGWGVGHPDPGRLRAWGGWGQGRGSHRAAWVRGGGTSEGTPAGRLQRLLLGCRDRHPATTSGFSLERALGKQMLPVARPWPQRLTPGATPLGGGGGSLPLCVALGLQAPAVVVVVSSLPPPRLPPRGVPGHRPRSGRRVH